METAYVLLIADKSKACREPQPFILVSSYGYSSCDCIVTLRENPFSS